MDLPKLHRHILSEAPRHTANLRKGGGSVMLAVPPALLGPRNLGVEAEVSIGMEDVRLIVEPTTRPRYTLEELLAQCDDAAALSAEDRAWLNARPVGNELLS